MCDEHWNNQYRNFWLSSALSRCSFGNSTSHSFEKKRGRNDSNPGAKAESFGGGYEARRHFLKLRISAYVEAVCSKGSKVTGVR